jgi:lipopolysaccharide export LptBFGC system permease protein LptF
MIIKHREKSINFIVAALTAGIYYLFFLLGETLTQYHILPPPLAMWLPNIVVTLAGIFLFYKYANFR